MSGITTGVLTATIDPTETVGELATLSRGGTNKLTITIRAEDATAATAGQLNTITMQQLQGNLTNVTALAASSLSDLGTLATAIAADPAQFSLRQV